MGIILSRYWLIALTKNSRQIHDPGISGK